MDSYPVGRIEKDIQDLQQEIKVHRKAIKSCKLRIIGLESVRSSLSDEPGASSHHKK